MTEESHSSPESPSEGEPESTGAWPRRVRVSIEGAWKEGCHLAQTILDSVVLPSGGFSAVAFVGLTTAVLFALSLPVVAVVLLGGLVLVAGLECLVLLVYAYPGAAFLASLVGGIAPPVIVYWALHELLDVQGDWTVWGAWPLLLAGLYGSYYYWRFGRAIVAMGEGTLQFYSKSAPTVAEALLAPFAVMSAAWRVLQRVWVVVQRVARDLIDVVSGRYSDRANGSEASRSRAAAEPAEESKAASSPEDGPDDRPSER